MISRLSQDSQRGIHTFCDTHDIRELCAGSVFSPDICAWLYFILRAAPDDTIYFPHGKWATIQALEAILAQLAIRELKDIALKDMEKNDTAEENYNEF